MRVWIDMYLDILKDENPHELCRINRLPPDVREATLASVGRALALHDKRLRAAGLADEGTERAMRREYLVDDMRQLARTLSDEMSVALFQAQALRDGGFREHVRIAVLAGSDVKIEIPVAPLDADGQLRSRARQASVQGLWDEFIDPAGGREP